MRKFRYLGIVVITAVAAALPMTPAGATTSSHHVLTTKKVGGSAVKKGAVLKAGLAKGTKAVFASSIGSLTCSKSSFTSKVVSNPAKPGTARESLTKQTFSKCKISISGVTIGSLTISNLPYKITVSDAKGHPVKVSETSKTKPLKATIKVVFEGSAFACSLKASDLAGKASNKGNKITFTKQKLKKLSGPSLCPSSAMFSASYGPVTDSSVKGSPKVFVN